MGHPSRCTVSKTVPILCVCSIFCLLIFNIRLTLLLDKGHSLRISRMSNQWQMLYGHIQSSLYVIRGQKRLPNVLIIGVRKGGTRALLEFLSMHPDIRAAEFETHYFDNDSNYQRGSSWYRSEMPLSLAHQWTIEKTPAYFVNPVVPYRVYSTNPRMKLILIVRNPVTRLVSDYSQIRYNKVSRQRIHHSLWRSSIVNGSLNLRYKPVRNSLYHVHVKQWLNYFPLNQIHVVDGDRFITDPFPELQRVEDFLLLPHLVHKHHIYFDRSKGFFCYQMANNTKRCLGDTKGRAHVDIQNKTITRLKQLFNASNERFFELIQKRFEWN